jgi:pimeloyl-ACP methyl ester carboxylesterase
MLQADVAGIIAALSSVLPPIDKKALVEDSGMGVWMVDSMHESLKINSDGWVDDDLAFIKPWGFELSEVKVPVLLYQGTEDKMVPYAHGEWLAKHLPQEKLRKHLLPGEGHISLLVGKSDDQIAELLKEANI